MDHLGDLNLFLRVLDLGSISAAARSLDLSVAVASQRLKRLERGLGVRLFHRTTRQLRPTPEGLALAEQGRPLVEELDVLTSSLRGTAKSVAGTLRVSLPATFGKQYISPLLPQFMARHPRLRLHIDLSDQMRDWSAKDWIWPFGLARSKIRSWWRRGSHRIAECCALHRNICDDMGCRRSRRTWRNTNVC